MTVVLSDYQYTTKKAFLERINSDNCYRRRNEKPEGKGV
jgi:hypothetical protein